MRALKGILSITAGRDGDTLAFAAAYLVLLPFYLAPLLVTPLLPGQDLPFHLAMVDLLAKAGRPDSPYAPFYDGRLSLAPYAAHYLALWGLGKVVPLMAAHKAIMAIYVAALPLSVASLLAACQRSRLPALLAFPLAYNLAVHYGFISFALSLPVLFVLLAQLVRLLVAPTPGPIAGRWLITAGAALLLFLCHLQNFLYGVGAALGFVALTAAPLRRRLQAASALLPALLALALWQLRAADDQGRSLSFALDAVVAKRRLDVGELSWLADLKGRLAALPVHALRGFADRADARACRTLLVLVTLYALIGWWMGRQRGQAPDAPRPLRAPLWVAFGGALLAYLGLPHHLQAYEITTLFPRFAPLVLLMMLPLVPAGLRGVEGRLRWLLVAPAVLFVAVYGGQLVKRYRLYAAETADFRAVLAHAEPGRRAVGLTFDRQSHVMSVSSALLGLTSFYPVLKPAPGSMTPLAFCDLRHIPCRRRSSPDTLPDPGPWTPERFDPDQAVPFFDYFFVRSPPPSRDPFGAQGNRVELVSQQGTWSLYRRKVAP